MLVRWLFAILLTCLVVPPAAAGPWTSAEYTRQYALHYLGKVPLPHLGNAEQALLFDHLVDQRAIISVVASGGSVDGKLVELRKIFATVCAYRASYNLAMTYGEPLSEELTRVQAFTLEIATAIAALIQQKGERTYSAHGAFTTQIAAVIQSISEAQRFTGEQRVALAEAIVRRYPAIAPVLTADDRQQLFDVVSDADFRVATSRQQAAVAAMWSTIEGAL